MTLKEATLDISSEDSCDASPGAAAPVPTKVKPPKNDSSSDGSKDTKDIKGSSTEAAFFEALNHVSLDTLEVFLHQIGFSVPRQINYDVALKSVMAIIQEHAPRNSAELALVKQMIVIDYRAMELARLLASPDPSALAANLWTNQLIKLTRTYAALLEALARSQGKAKTLSFRFEHITEHITVTGDGTKTVIGTSNSVDRAIAKLPTTLDEG